MQRRISEAIPASIKGGCMFLAELKRLSLKKLTGSIILNILILAVIGVFFGSSFVKLLEGPKYLYDLSAGNLDHQYVEVDEIYMEGVFAETVETSKSTHSESISDRYYTVMFDESRLFAVRFDAEDFKKAEQLYSEFENYYAGISDSVNSYFPFYGTIRKMDSEEMDYYYDWFDQSIYYGNVSRDYALPYVLEVNHVGIAHKGIVIGALAVFCLTLLSLLYKLIRWASGGYQKRILRFLNDNPMTSIELLEEDYRRASIKLDTVVIGRTYIFNICAAAFTVNRISDIIWAYEHTVKDKNKISYYIVLGTSQKEKIKISVKNEEEIQLILGHFIEMKYPIIIGYDKVLEDAYQNQPDEFRAAASRMYSGESQS